MREIFEQAVCLPLVSLADLGVIMYIYIYI